MYESLASEQCKGIETNYVCWKRVRYDSTINCWKHTHIFDDGTSHHKLIAMLWNYFDDDWKITHLFETNIIHIDIMHAVLFLLMLGFLVSVRLQIVAMRR